MKIEELKLSKGKGTPDSPCLMSKSSLAMAHRHGTLTPGTLDDVFTDNPCWADPIIRPMVVFTNDILPEGSPEFERLDALMPRVLAATKIGDASIERRVHAQVLCAEARKGLDLTRVEDRLICERAIVIREKWLRGEATEEDCAAWAAEAAGAADAAWAAEAAEAAGAAGAARAAEAAEAAWAERNAVDRLTEFLDCYEKARAEEGVMVDDSYLDLLAANGLLVDNPNQL